MKLSDDDFDKVHAALAVHPLGELMIKDYEPVIDPTTDLPAVDNAFILSIRQLPEGPGHLAHTRIDIRGEDGLIQTSFERDHLHFEPLDETSIGKTLLLDVTHQERSAFVLEPVLDAGGEPLLEEESQRPLMRSVAVPSPVQTLLSKDTVISAEHVALLQSKNIRRVATKLLSTDEISAALLPLLDDHHKNLPDNAMPVLTALKTQAAARIARAAPSEGADGADVGLAKSGRSRQ